MNPYNETDVNDEKGNNDSIRTKVIAAIPMAGIIVTTALLSGLLLSFSGSSYPQAMAQQNMTGTTGATTGGGGGGAQ
ncbi:MAG TPA: hypothetical protein VE572_05070, partial [Nitrososphaeraceae archaeon]|nr:hypothetical protein [Nitrososphaeraceae archaeon]